MAFGKITAARDSRPRNCSGADSSSFHYCVVKNATTLYKGGIVVWEASNTGYVHFGSNTASEPLAGIAAETVVGDGTLKIKLWKKGEHYFEKTTPAITDDGDLFYVEGGASGTNAIVQSGTTTGTVVGIGTYDSDDSSGIWLKIDGKVTGG